MATQRYTVTPHPIETLLTWVKSGEIAIPGIQRPFVWEATRVRNLPDSAVLAAYGFSAKKDLLAQLLTLNLEVAAKVERGEPVAVPGVPKVYPDHQELVTEDCIRPN